MAEPAGTEIIHPMQPPVRAAAARLAEAAAIGDPQAPPPPPPAGTAAACRQQPVQHRAEKADRTMQTFVERLRGQLRQPPCVRRVAAWIGSVIPGALEDTHGSLRTEVQRRGGGPLAASRELIA